MKAIAHHPFGFVAARDGQQPGHARQVAMKSRVEARKLRDTGIMRRKRFQHGNFSGQMFRIKWTQPPQFLEHLSIDLLRLAIEHPAMNDPVRDRRGCVDDGLEQTD